MSEGWRRLRGMKELCTSAGARARQEHAARWLSGHPRALVVAPTLQAAAEVSRLALGTASFGWIRLTPGRLAGLLAAPLLAQRKLSPVSSLGLEAVCARVLHALRGSLGRFEPVSGRPGLSRALSRSLQEVRLAGVRPEGDLGRIVGAVEEELLRSGLADRAEVFRLAAEAAHEWLGLPALLLDLPLASALEERLFARLRGPVLATAPAGDARAIERLGRALGAAPRALDEPGETALSRVQRHLFTLGEVPAGGSQEGVLVLSAPGESRECVEIARLVLREAARGVPFDRMAVLLRAPSQYRAPLEEAFARAGIPAWFAQGTLRPDPAGRAFLALLGCAAEGLSARRFAEYLSLGEVPQPDARGEPPQPLPSGDRWVPPDAELAALPLLLDDAPPEQEPVAPLSLDQPVVAGSLRAPWRWEQLLLDAAVIGGRERWERRLNGLAAQLRLQLAEAAEDEARAASRQRQLDDLGALRAFALPLLDALAALPAAAFWGEWLEQLTALATQALREPSRVLALLSELAPMAPVGPVSLSEVRLVLGRRLGELPTPPAQKRQGRVFVAPVAISRGLSFEVVFVPGLAEKLFPQKVVEDPLLPDRERRKLPGLDRNEDRVAAERLALRVAVGAAARQLVLSWPRLDLQQARARVPSFYGLEVVRAAEGALPAFAALSRKAEQAGAARAGWPAPREPGDAIDEAEHDLALLEKAFRLPEAESRGIAHYLLDANPHLKRALRSRARRWLKRWTPADGLVQPSPEALALLQTQLPSARPYSPTALQNYASCPYKFVLQAVHRLAPREVPERIDEIDPLARGSLIHEVQFKLLSELQKSGELPLKPARLEHARSRLAAVLAEVAAEWSDKLDPAIERVWEDCIASVNGDLREWLRRMTEDETWTPWRFELSFGLPDTLQRDAHSVATPVKLDEGVLVRGSIDLVEQARDGALRATDYKTGKAWAQPGTIIGGGSTLQPALYALVLEKLFPGTRVQDGRLYYCTYTGEFSEVPVPLDTAARGSVKVLVDTLAAAVTQGFLPAAPKERECERCDYLSVCGPAELARVKRKPAEALQPLVQLRGMP